MADDQQPHGTPSPPPQFGPRPLSRVVWIGAKLRGSNMAGIDLEGADLRASDCRGVNFSNANLRYADLRGANITGANFQNANLYGARLQGVEARDSDFRGANVEQVNWGGAYLDGIVLPPPIPPRLPSTEEILADPKRYLSPEQANGHGPENGHGKGPKR
jgi:uncharacterized protein YjbI with pentapeptide repeats